MFTIALRCQIMCAIRSRWHHTGTVAPGWYLGLLYLYEVQPDHTWDLILWISSFRQPPLEPGTGKSPLVAFTRSVSGDNWRSLANGNVYSWPTTLSEIPETEDWRPDRSLQALGWDERRSLWANAELILWKVRITVLLVCMIMSFSSFSGKAS